MRSCGWAVTAARYCSLHWGKKGEPFKLLIILEATPRIELGYTVLQTVA
jgi:hypothetical protein